jgi:hypothetical protein
MGDVADDAVQYVRELARRDVELAAALESVARLQERAGVIAERTTRLGVLLERLPHERQTAADAVARRESDLEARRGEAVEAERAAAESRRPAPELEVAAARARRAVERAEEELGSARRRVVDLERDAGQAQEEASALERAAAAAAAELASAPRIAAHIPDPPGAGLDGLRAWVARAEAALLLARTGLNAEREAVVREANELAAVVLGGALAPSGVAQIRDRVENAGFVAGD